MKRLLKPSACLAAVILLMPACSPKGPANPPDNAQVSKGPARFIIIPNDVAGIAEVTTRRLPGTNAEYVIHLQFTDAKAVLFRDFTRTHVNQQVQLLVGGHVVASPVIAAEITSGQADLTFPSAADVQKVLAWLSHPKVAATNAGAPGGQAPLPGVVKVTQ